MLTLPKQLETTTPYITNMRALCEVAPHFAQELDLIDPQDFIELEETRNGMVTCKVNGDNGRKVYLHSRYDPQREAEQWADGAEEQAEKQIEENEGKIPACFIVDGFGLGYHIQALAERITGDTFIAVCESNTTLIRMAFELFDFSEMIKDGRLLIITDTNRSEIFKKFEKHTSIIMLGVVYTHALQKYNQEFYTKIHKTIGEYMSFLRANIWTLIGCHITTCENLISNLPTYLSTPSIEIYKKRFEGKPAIVVSAGPSLRKNLELLKKIRPNVVVIAVQTVLKPLLNVGIEPDFVTSLDFSHVCKRFFEGVGELPKVQMVAEPKAHSDVIDTYRDIGPITLLWNEFLSVVLEGYEDPHDNLTGGTTVAHLSFYLAQYIGADPIIFIGQDLGFTNHVYYSPGNALHDIWKPELNRFCTMENKEFERILRQGQSLRRVKDCNDKPIYTDEEMFTYLQQFERDFAKSTSRVIDATGGGVKKQFSQVMTLEEAAEEFCKDPIPPSLFEYPEISKWFNPKPLKKCKDILNNRIEEAEEFREIVIETIDLVTEMLELVEDQAALNNKMIRLDELRVKVSQRPKIYQLIGSVSQTAEWIRFRNDRAIGIQNNQGTKRQRQQLLRDINYVTQLKDGCQRLIDLLHKGVERIEDELKKHDNKESNNND